MGSLRAVHGMGSFRARPLLLAAICGALPLAASAFRHTAPEEKSDDAAVLTQMEMMRGFGALFRDAPVYRKKTTVRARSAAVGEKVNTVVGGEQETTKTAEEGDMLVSNTGGEGELMLMSQQGFADRYYPASENDTDEDGFRTYLAKGMVKAVVVQEDIMEKLRAGSSEAGTGMFMARWNETMLVQLGDILAMPFPKEDEIYRIWRPVFESTYAPKVMTQAEMMKEFGDLLVSSMVYKKVTTVRARLAAAGEIVNSIVHGEQETTNKAKKGDMLVSNTGGEGELILMSRQNFDDRYYPTSEDDTDGDGFRTYLAKGKIKAVVATGEVMKKLRAGFGGGETRFVAAWGETMLVDPGDVLAMPHPKHDEIYRIAWSVFENTYGAAE